MVLEWERGSTEIGDFTWSGFSMYAALTPRAAAVLRPFSGWEAGGVEMVQDKRLYRQKSSRTRVLLPYGGPPLVELCVVGAQRQVRLGPAFNLDFQCQVCGATRVSLNDYSEDHGWEEGAGLVVSGGKEPGVFQLQYLGGIYCCDEVKTAIEAAGLTNCAFLRIGATEA